MNKNNLFVVGTVVLLKNGEKRVMITGYFPIVDGERKVYDYCGCLFPEGNISSELNILFNHEDIDKVYYEGPKSDEEANNFISKLDEYYKEINKKLEQLEKDKNNSIETNELPFIE